MKPRNLLFVVLILLFTTGGCEKEMTGSPEPNQSVAIINVSVPTTCVQGDILRVMVTVENRGDQKQTFEVTLSDRADGKKIASQSVTLSAKHLLHADADVIFTGGVAKNIGVVKAVRENLGCEVLVPEAPLISGAVGAALLGKELTLEALAKGEPIQRKERRLAEATFFK